MKIIQILFTLILLHLDVTTHTCVHDTLNPPIKQIAKPSLKTIPLGNRKVTSSNYESIRIHADYSSLTQGNEIIREYIINQLVPSAISYFQATLKVIREQQPLTADFQCADLIPPNYLVTTGVNADLILLITADYFQESFVAAAVPCALTEPTNRPVYGAVFFNLNYLPTMTASELEENLSTTLHEITHVLGFADYLYPYYIDPETNQRQKNNVGTKMTDQKQVTYLNLPPLTNRLREHFNCPTLEGAFLENQGSTGSAGSHFERKIFMNEFMTASTVTDPVVSEFTLALLEGTGWYKVDYERAELFTWGKGKGCSFLNDKCVDQNAVPRFEEFCSPLTRISCTYTARAIGICGTVRTVFTDPDLDPAFNYWGNNTVVLDPFVDNCPYYTGFQFTDCENPENQLTAFYSGEKYGTTSRCYGGTLGAKNIFRRHFGFCFPTKCELMSSISGYRLTLEVNGAPIVCTKSENITIDGELGYLECPDPNIFCAKSNPAYCERSCSGRGVCNDGVCRCPEGWAGSDCGLRAYGDNCDRCKGNSEDTSCFGDGCECNHNTNECTGPALIGGGGEYISSPDDGHINPVKSVKPFDYNKIGILIWMIVCVIVMFWKTKLTRDV